LTPLPVMSALTHFREDFGRRSEVELATNGVSS
jgi:hypothetical protein